MHVYAHNVIGVVDISSKWMSCCSRIWAHKRGGPNQLFARQYAPVLKYAPAMSSNVRIAGEKRCPNGGEKTDEQTDRLGQACAASAAV
jgi:hypothetical protein